MKQKVIQGCIYLLRNLLNGKGYVGQHKNAKTVEDVRWKSHIVAALEKSSKYYLHCAIRKYGVKKFSAEILWCGPVDKLNEKEVYYIKKFHTFVDDPKGGGYNLTLGGNQKTKFSVRSRSKMSDSQVLRFTDPEEGAKHSVKMRKLYEDEAARKKVSVGLKKWYKENPEAILLVAKKSAISTRRRYEDPEQRIKTSEASKRMWANPVHRKTLLTSLRSPEVRAQISKTLSATLTELYKDPTERAKKSATLVRAYAENPEFRKNVSAGNKRRYKDPAQRRKTGELSKAGWARRRAAGLHNKNYKGGRQR
jgi:group I intron endonuclease